MKKIVYFLLLLMILSACGSGASQKLGAESSNWAGSDQKGTENVAASDFQPPASSLLAGEQLTISSSEVVVSKAGEPLTSFQLQLVQALEERRAAGLAVPASVKFEYQATSSDPMQQITGTVTTPTRPVKVVSKTVMVFDGPEQAGYSEWPPLVVEDKLSAGVQGTVREGDYTELYRKFMNEKSPGYWEKYEFGQEPRTHTIVETIEFTYPRLRLLDSASNVTLQQETSEQLLMGFTYTGPHLNYTIEDSLEDPIFGFEIYSFKAGLELDWALGLRLPGEADLVGPDQLALGSPYMLSSSMTPLDWSATNYSSTGVAPENGNEFVLRLNFFVGVEGHVFGVDLCSSCHINVAKDFSKSFATPFGPGASFPIPTVDIPIYEFDLSLFYFSTGFKLDPTIGSSMITANWQASQDASGSGQITYNTSGTPVSFGPINACNLGSSSVAEVKVDDFRYWFTEFLIDLSVYLNFKLFGYGVWDPTYSIAKFDLGPLTGGLYLDAHVQCDWDFSCSPAGPDHTLDLSIPVVDLVPPTTSLTPSGTAGNNGWFVSDVQVSLSATDMPAGCGIGVKKIEYSLDGINWNTYSGPFTISDEGLTTLHYRSIDNEDNVETANTQTVKVDKTPPTVTGAPTVAANVYGWYNTDVVVHFSAEDAVSGIATLTSDQILSGEGANQSVTGTAMDEAGLSASFTVTGINIDKTQPGLVITSPEARTYGNTESFNAIWNATDGLSGIAEEAGAIDGATVTNGQLIELLLLGPGPHTMSVEATDKADNTSSASVVFFVTVDSEGLLAALEYMCDLNLIEKHGVCNGLAAKLSAAIKSKDKGHLNAAENQLNAFLNQLDAQRGKAINETAYEVLRSGAQYVIEHLND